MFTTSRVSLPLAIAPRICLQSGHSLALSAVSSVFMRSVRRAIADCTVRTFRGSPVV